MKTPHFAAVLTLVLSAHVAMADTDSGHGHGSQQKSQHQHNASSIGKAGDSKAVTRTIVVDMNDGMRFAPASINVKQNEVIRFVVKNSGKLKHEMVIGSMSDLHEHAAMMAKSPDMMHAEANQVTIESGKAADLIWQFDKPGKVDFACLQPGHFEAGMKGQVQVSSR